MTVARTARFRASCTVCGVEFEPTPEQVSAVGGPYCGKRCVRTARQARRRAADRPPCAACGEPWEGIYHYGLALCVQCRTVAFQSCWRKRRWDTDPGTFALNDGTPLTGYHCDICEHWHTTTVRHVSLPEGYAERRDQIGAYLRSVGFDLDAARGWSTPPGSHTREESGSSGQDSSGTRPA